MEEIKNNIPLSNETNTNDTLKPKIKTNKAKKTVDEVEKTVIYMGPSIIKSGIISNTIFNKGLSNNLKILKEKCPIVNNLILEPVKASEALRQIQNKNGSAYIAYKKVEEYVKKVVENNEL